jgi:DNA polymerase-4
LAGATSVTQEILQAAIGLLAERMPARPLRVRLLGVGVSDFDNPEQAQGSLFADEDRQRHSRLDETADRLKERFGLNAIQRGSSLLHDAKHRPVPRPGGSAP